MPLIVKGGSFKQRAEKYDALKVAEKFKSMSVDEIVTLLSQTVPDLSDAIALEKALNRVRRTLKQKPAPK